MKKKSFQIRKNYVYKHRETCTIYTDYRSTDGTDYQSDTLHLNIKIIELIWSEKKKLISV